jgi:poly-beta-1,6-N-acetyl-D-glucosamine biosynthesis protein PgaD
LNRDIVLTALDLGQWLRDGGITPSLTGSAAVIATLGAYAGVVAFNTSSFIVWALYNQLRFRGKERRCSASPVRPEELAERCTAPTEDIAAWQSARILVFSHDLAGNIEYVQIGALFSCGDP